MDSSEIAVGSEYAAGPDSRRNPFGTRARVRVVATGIRVPLGCGPIAQVQSNGVRVRVRVIEPALEGPLDRTLREYEIPPSDLAMRWPDWCRFRARSSRL